MTVDTDKDKRGVFTRARHVEPRQFKTDRGIDKPAEHILDLVEIVTAERRYDENQMLDFLWNLPQVDGNDLAVARTGQVVAAVLNAGVAVLLVGD